MVCIPSNYRNSHPGVFPSPQATGVKGGRQEAAWGGGRRQAGAHGEVCTCGQSCPEIENKWLERGAKKWKLNSGGGENGSEGRESNAGFSPSCLLRPHLSKEC